MKVTRNWRRMGALTILRLICAPQGFSIAVLALTLCPAAFSQDYEIRLDRPDPVGSRFHLSVVGKESTSQIIKQGDKVIQDHSVNFSVEAELVVTVLAVSEKGKNTKLKLEVERLTRIEGDARRELAPKGSVITASLNGQEQVFEMAGATLEPDTQDSLKLLDLLTDDPNGPTDDEVLGTKERKKVGDRWEGNAELMAKEMLRLGLTIKKEDLKSAITLEKVVKVGNTECLQFSGVFTCDKFAPPLPPGFTVDKSTVKMSFSGKLPVATSLSLPDEGSMTMTMALSARGKPDPIADEVVLQMTSERSLSGRASEAK